MNRPLFLMLMSALAISSLAACHAPPDGNSASVARHIKISDGRVGAIAPNGQIAWVDAQGGIEVQGDPLDLNQDQRTQSADYHRQAITLREEAVRVGHQGIKTANTAVREVISGLANGNPDQIGNNIDQEARRVEEQVEKMCSQLVRLHGSQDALADAVPGFAEYATIDASTAQNCNHNAEPAIAEASGPAPFN